MIAGLFDNGALPTLERVVQFTSHRQKLLTANVANLSTPYYKPVDLDPKSFQHALSDAIDARRQRENPTSGPLDITDTEQLRFSKGGIEARPFETNDNILFHDQNNRDVERIMQRIAENTLAHNAAIDMIRNQFDMLEVAIRERL